MSRSKFKMSEKAIVDSCLFQPHYSGEASERIWSEVRQSLNDQALYLLGCALQDVEGRFLQALNLGVKHRARILVRQNRAKRRQRKR